MFGQSLLSAFGIACTTDTDQLFTTDVQTTSVATYQFNNATTSIPSNTYPGTPSNITYAAGKFGNAAVFNGSSSWISIPSQVSPSNDNSDFNYSFWLSTPGFTSGSKWVIGETSATGPVRIGLYAGVSTNNYTFDFLRRYGGSYYGYARSAEFTMLPSTFYHFSVNYYHSTKLWKLYFNGQEIYSTSTVTYTGAQTAISSVAIGRYNSGSAANYWNGSIDQLRIFNTALPQSAVTALYNETTTTATYDYVEYEGANPNSIAYYKMSDATDQLGNYNGTATNVNFNTEGKFGFAGAFNGTSSKINTGYIQTGQVYSASFWGKGFSAGASILRDTPAAGGANTFMDIATGANGQVIIGGNVALSPSYTPSTDWTHYAVVLDGTNATIYENGSQIATKTYTAKTGNNGTPVHMMSNGAYPVGFSGGYLDQVRIYDSALSAANVTALYNEIECPPLTTFYTSLNPSDAVNGSLSSGNLRFTSTTTPWSQCRTVQSVSSGKYYFEMYVHSATNNSLGIGIADASLSNSGSLWGQAAGGIVYYGQTGNKFENTASVGFSSAFGPGSWLMCAFDMDAGKLWFGLNGNWIGANPSTGNSPASSIIKTYITNAKPFANAYYVGNSVEMNFGNGNSVNANTFKYTPPTGFDGILA